MKPNPVPQWERGKGAKGVCSADCPGSTGGCGEWLRALPPTPGGGDSNPSTHPQHTEESPEPISLPCLFPLSFGDRTGAARVGVELGEETVEMQSLSFNQLQIRARSPTLPTQTATICWVSNT